MSLIVSFAQTTIRPCLTVWKVRTIQLHVRANKEMAQRFVPIWRDPAFVKRRNARRWLPEWSILAMSIGAGILLLKPGNPSNGGIDSPISYELHDRSPSAWILIVLMATILLLHGKSQIRNKRFVSGVAMWTVVVGLGVIAVTDPRSAFHLGVFMGVSLLAVAWLFLIGLDLEELRLQLLAFGAAAGIFTCQLFIGIGERILIGLVLLGLNLVHYGHLHDD